MCEREREIERGNTNLGKNSINMAHNKVLTCFFYLALDRDMREKLKGANPKEGDNVKILISFHFNTFFS